MSEQNKIVRPAFMDTIEAAAVLKTDRLAILKYIEEGKLRTFGGKSANPFVRTEDVDKLGLELQLNDDSPALDPKIVHRNDPVRKIKLRLQQDAKWQEVDEAAMRAWAKELDLIGYNRMREVAQTAIDQLQQILRVLDETQAERQL